MQLASRTEVANAAGRPRRRRGFAYWWRPGGMFLNLYLWLQNTMLTHRIASGKRAGG
jgi:hypothetical protein